MKKGLRNIFALLLMAGFVAACAVDPMWLALQGGSEAGNPPTALRLVEGTIPSGEELADFGFDTAERPCAAEAFLAIDRNEQIIGTWVEDDCRFVLWLASDNTYRFELPLDEDTSVPVLFPGETAEEATSYFPLDAGAEPIDFGRLQLEEVEGDLVAYPADGGINPLDSGQLQLEAEPETSESSESNVTDSSNNDREYQVDIKRLLSDLEAADALYVDGFPIKEIVMLVPVSPKPTEESDSTDVDTSEKDRPGPVLKLPDDRPMYLDTRVPMKEILRVIPAVDPS